MSIVGSKSLFFRGAALTHETRFNLVASLDHCFFKLFFGMKKHININPNWNCFNEFNQTGTEHSRRFKSNGGNTKLISIIHINHLKLQFMIIRKISHLDTNIWYLLNFSVIDEFMLFNFHKLSLCQNADSITKNIRKWYSWLVYYLQWVTMQILPPLLSLSPSASPSIEIITLTWCTLYDVHSFIITNKVNGW